MLYHHKDSGCGETLQTPRPFDGRLPCAAGHQAIGITLALTLARVLTPPLQSGTVRYTYHSVKERKGNRRRNKYERKRKRGREQRKRGKNSSINCYHMLVGWQHRIPQASAISRVPPNTDRWHRAPGGQVDNDRPRQSSIWARGLSPLALSPGLS